MFAAKRWGLSRVLHRGTGPGTGDYGLEVLEPRGAFPGPLGLSCLMLGLPALFAALLEVWGAGCLLHTSRDSTGGTGRVGSGSRGPRPVGHGVCPQASWGMLRDIGLVESWR